jgi:hypothetical protein
MHQGYVNVAGGWAAVGLKPAASAGEDLRSG